MLYFFSAGFALLTLTGSVSRAELETYWLGVPSRWATPFIDHLLIAISVIAASLLFGVALLRRSPIEASRTKKKRGRTAKFPGYHRNDRSTSESRMDG